MFKKACVFGLVAISSASVASASHFKAETYNALGGNAATDNLAQANIVLSDLVDWSKTGAYASVVRNGNGSAAWIGNSDTKSYFMTAAHVVNSATNTFTTHNGTTISPNSGSVFHTQDGDFALLEYNGVLDPSLFGGQSAVLMDYHLAENYSGDETAAVGYGILTIGERTLGRTRMLSFANLTRLDGQYRTQSTVSSTYDPSKPYAGVTTQGDSGGGVFLNRDGVDVLIGAVSAGNLRTGMVYTSIYQYKTFIDSVVPEGVFTWYSDTLTFDVGDEILFNGGFEYPIPEDNGVTDPESWTVYESDSPVNPGRQVRTRDQYVRSGDSALQLNAGDSDVGYGTLQQTVGTDVGYEYEFEIWARTATLANNGYSFSVEFFDGTDTNGILLATIDSGDILSLTYQDFSTQVTAISDHITILISDTSMAFDTDLNTVGYQDGNDIILDDASFIVTAVPEPSSLALIGLGSLTILRRRRGGWHWCISHEAS